MLFGSNLVSRTHPTQTGTTGSTHMNTFHWLVILGFPVEVAAAKAMPELFSDIAPAAFVTDGVRIFFRDAA